MDKIERLYGPAAVARTQKADRMQWQHTSLKSASNQGFNNNG